MKVSVVASLCVERDAISESVRGTIEALNQLPNIQIRLFSFANEYSGEFDSRSVSSASDVLLDPYFNSSDVIFYHFGIYYDHFNAILLGNGRARQIVCYHNVTPPELVPEENRSLIYRSLRQRANIAVADVILAVSEYNKSDLVEMGIPSDKIEVCPLYVKFDTEPGERTSSAPPVNLLYVGRFVRSKGVLDLMDATQQLRVSGIPFRLRMVGNIDFSDRDYVKLLRERIAQLDLSDTITIHGSVSDEELAGFYDDADIFVMPSYHEGFCVPVLEALHAGCVPITYDAGNLPNLVGDFGVIVPTGDVNALGASLLSLASQFRAGIPSILTLQSGPISWSRYRAGVVEYLEQFSFEQFARRIKKTVLNEPV